MYATLSLAPVAPRSHRLPALVFDSAVVDPLQSGRWTEVFGDATLPAALLDRLTHHNHVFVFEGESYRFRESAGRLTRPRKKDELSLVNFSVDEHNLF